MLYSGTKTPESNDLSREIDTTDRRIIALLQMDGRMSNVDIARSVGLAEATVRKRIDRLLKEGFVRVVGVPAVDRLGLEVETIIMLKVDLSQVQQTGEQLAAMEEVRSVKYATGEYDIIVEAVFPSDEQLLGFLTRRMARVEGVYATATSHVLKNIKESCDWLLPREGPPLILVVDDDPDFVEATRIVLESAGYQVTSAANGEQGLRAMYRDRPDLVILDVMMNGILDGLDASFRMRAERGVSKTPILMVSSIAGSDYAAMFPTDEYVPVENFLSKPVGPDQLLAEVKRLLP
jgi:Lrp/AsnC family transcriptional regulator for asnA, asnC and gidA